jgi:hypothetical protein
MKGPQTVVIGTSNSSGDWRTRFATDSDKSCEERMANPVIRVGHLRGWWQVIVRTDFATASTLRFSGGGMPSAETSV